VDLRGRALLIVDDSITIRAAIRRALEPTGLFQEYIEAKNGQEGLGLLAERAIDVVLCDVLMPDLDGFEFLRLAKADPRHQDVPVILLTGQESVEKKVAGLDLGASDYVTKPFAKDELIARVRVHLKLKLTQDKLREASTTDYLTKRFNRRHFMELFLAEFERSKRHGHALSLAILDVDHFKRINDTYGHAQGDRVLVAIAELLRASVRREDVVARYGGEEFAILWPHIDEAGARVAADKIRGVVADARFEGMGDTRVTASLGFVSFSGAQPGTASVDVLLMLADTALYRAKESGRNRVEVMPIPT
jgi:two-component system cell cycle response regulator